MKLASVPYWTCRSIGVAPIPPASKYRSVTNRLVHRLLEMVRGSWLLLLLVICNAPSSVAAEERRAVEPDKPAVLATASSAFENIVAGRGSAVSTASRSDPKKFDLVYTARAADAGLEDVVTYVSDGKAGRITVTISGGGQPGTLTGPELYGPAFKLLFALFVIALLLESALAVLFNWRPFVQIFDARGVKTLVSVGAALVLVLTFDLDIVTRLVNLLLSSQYPASDLGLTITALILAGGSSGVNTLLTSLGFRPAQPAAAVIPKPPPTKAWLSVTLARDAAAGPVYVYITPAGDPDAVAGTITGSVPQNPVARYFLRNLGRFPGTGGYSVDAGKQYSVQLKGRDADGKELPSEVWGPNAVAPGAIIDIVLKL